MLRLFCFTDHCQYTPFIYLRPLVFGLTPCGWGRCIALNATYEGSLARPGRKQATAAISGLFSLLPTKLKTLLSLLL